MIDPSVSTFRHCERSEAISQREQQRLGDCRVTTLLAMTNFSVAHSLCSRQLMTAHWQLSDQYK